MDKIPHILHMTWVGPKEPPQYFWDNLNKWKSLMPNWTYMIWTNDMLTEEYFDKEYLSIMKTVRNPSQLSDFIRFYVLEKWGGYYLDADITPFRNLEELKYKHPIILCNDIAHELTPVYMMCAFIAGIPNHPLWKSCIEACMRVDVNEPYGIDVCPTGPAVLGWCTYLNSGYVLGVEDYPYPSYKKKVLEKFTLLPYFYFYRNRIGDQGPYGGRVTEDNPIAFGNHFYDNSWEEFERVDEKVEKMEGFFKKTVINLAEESKCISKKVGALIVKDNRIVSTGYNGTLPGIKNCNEHNHNSEQHHEWSIKNELHAEQNAIIMAAKTGISLNGCKCYTSLQPCNTCLLMLLQCGITEIIYLNEYSQSNYSDDILEFIKSNKIILRKFR